MDLSNLKDYDTPRLEASAELQAFKKAMVNLKEKATYGKVENLCQRSRLLLSALLDDCWATGKDEKHNRKAVAQALKAFDQAASLRAQALQQTASTRHAKIETFFTNIAKRKDRLTKERA